MTWRRALVVWLVIIIAETVHGVLRQLFLTPVVGDLPARQIGVAVGSVIIVAIAVGFSRWLGARSLREQLAVGFVWIVLTLAFELMLGILLGLSRERLLADYNPAEGGFMVIGLLCMLLAPTFAAWARRVGNRGTT